MEHAEMVALIRGGVPQPGGVWADLGAGTGNFTWALRDLLGDTGVIYAIDRDARAIAEQTRRLAGAAPGAQIIPQQADVTRPLALPPLDGALLANLLHFIRDQEALVRRLAAQLRPKGRLLIVEYEAATPLPWVPFPVPLARFSAVAAAAGFASVEQVGARRSPSSGQVMYAAVARLAAAG